MPAAFEIAGPLDPGALDRALVLLEPSATRFCAPPSRPARKGRGSSSTRRPPALLEEIELDRRRSARGSPAPARSRRRPASLSTFCAGRSGAPTCGASAGTAGAAVLLLNIHHIACDGWSYGILLEELSRLYAAQLAGAAVGEAAGQPALLPPLALRYSDYAAWLESHLAGDRLDPQLAYWRGAARRHRAARDPHRLPAAALFQRKRRRLRARSRRRRQPPAARFRARSAAKPLRDPARRAQSALARFCASDDVAVGTVVAGRPKTELEIAGRLFRQHPGAAHLAGRRAELRRASGALPRHFPRRPGQPGGALRAAGRGAAAGARRVAPPADPGDVPGDPRPARAAARPAPPAAPSGSTSSPRNSTSPWRSSKKTAPSGCWSNTTATSSPG